MLSKCEYSEKELQLAAYFGLTDLVENCFPSVAYMAMANKAFMDNDQSEYAHSLRRCIRALEQDKIKGNYILDYSAVINYNFAHEQIHH